MRKSPEVYRKGADANKQGDEVRQGTTETAGMSTAAEDETEKRREEANRGSRKVKGERDRTQEEKIRMGTTGTAGM